MIVVTAKWDDCPGDNCPTLAEDTASGDVVVQLYALTPEQAAETDAAMGTLPDGEFRGAMPSAVFNRLVARRSEALG